MFQKRSFLAESGKARFLLPQTPFKTKVVVEGFWNDHWLLAEDSRPQPLTGPALPCGS
jgi:hypothetical protein